MIDTLIIGAGAAGLFCAMQAAQQTGKKGLVIRVIDHANKPGKKILMSGGGKCNFTNYTVEPDNYLSENIHFCKSALSQYTNWDFIALVEKHAVNYEVRKHGQLFCVNSAKDILNMLLAECEQAGVVVSCHTHVRAISVQPDGSYQIDTVHSDGSTHESIGCRHLVIATGGLSIPTMGATGFGYEVATQFGHQLIPRRAGLVPFTFTDDIGDMAKSLSGNAIDVVASSCPKQLQYPMSFAEAMLFTHRGLSGPAMLQISNYWSLGQQIVLDLLPKLDISDWLLRQKRHRPKSVVRTLLVEHLPKSVVIALQERIWRDVADKCIGDISNQRLEKIGQTLQQWHIKPSGTEGYRTAEVTLGGVSVDEVSSKTMESLRQPNLYFIGEVLDVTGWLGGYNFQWAWSSAYACARHIVSV